MWPANLTLFIYVSTYVEVTHQAEVQQIPGSIPDCYVCFLVLLLLLLCFYFFVQITLFVMKFVHFFTMLISLVFLTYCHSRPVIRVQTQQVDLASLGRHFYKCNTSEESFNLMSFRAYSFFSSPEHKVLRVSYCDRPLSVVRRRASCVVRRASCVVRKLFYLNIFSSETTHWIWTKLHRNDSWVVPYQSCSNGSDWLHKQVTG